MESDDSRDGQFECIRVYGMCVRVGVEDLVHRLADKKRECSLGSYVELSRRSEESVYDSRYSRRKLTRLLAWKRCVLLGDLQGQLRG